MNTSTSSQAITPLPPDADAKALVPAEENEFQPDYTSLLDDQEFINFLNKIADFAATQSNSEAQWDRRRKTVQLRKYMLGEYYGVYDKHRGWYSDKEEGDGIYYSPETATFLDTLLKDLIKTKPQRKCEARDPERVDKREAARVAEKLLSLDDENDSTPKRQQREWKWNLLTAGETYRITYFDASKTGCGVTRDKYEQVMIEGGDTAYFCSICGNTEMSADGKCSACLNPQMDEYTSLGSEISVKKGTEYQQVGDVDYDVPDALEMTVIGDTDSIDEALIVRRERMIPRCVLADALGDENLPQATMPDTLRYKLFWDDREESHGTIPEFELLHYEELWVAPAVISGYKFPSNTKTKGGKTIGKKTPGKKLFPHGFYFSRVGKVVKTLYPYAMSECLSHASNAIGESFHGQGEWDLIELQDQLTEAKSMKMNSMLLDSTQPLIIREGFINSDEFENKFGLIVEAKNYPTDRPLDDVMTRLRPANPPAEAYQLGEEIKGQMQSRTGAFSTQSDAPDIKAMGTATGIAAITEQTLGRRAPALQLYAQMTVDQAYQSLELRQKYWPRKMYAAITKDLGTDAVAWFMECNIRQDIAISVVPNSWMPRTETQKQAGFQTFLQITGEILAAKAQSDPKIIDEILRQANERFGAGIDFNDMQTESIEARLRLDKVREVGEFVEEQFGDALYDPMTGGINPEAMMLAYSGAAELLRIVHVATDEQDIFTNLPLDPMFDQHTEFEEAYTDWLKTAEGRAASPFNRTLVRELAEYHIQAEAFRQMKLSQYANAAQLPDLQAGLIAQDAQNQQQLEQNAKMREQEMLYGGIEQAFAPAAEEGSAPAPAATAASASETPAAAGAAPMI